MKKYFLLLSFLALNFLLPAQTKLLTIEDALVNNRTTLAPENLKQLQFLYGTEDYVYLQKTNGQDAWMRGNTKPVADQPFLTLSSLNQKLKAAGSDTVM